MAPNPMIFRTCKFPLPWALVVVTMLVANASPRVFGQAGLREALERLDRDGDGEIEPKEITPLARPYLERIAEARKISLTRPNRIETWQQAARVYHALANGVSGRRYEMEEPGTILPFGPRGDEAYVPEFGLAEIKYPYTDDDLDEADDTLRRYDRDDDGTIDRREAERGRWTHRDPFAMDLNQDDRLSRLELAQRYARRRLLEGQSDELIQKARRVGNGIRRSVDDDDDDRNDSQWWRSGGNRYWLTASILSRFDANRNGRLERDEAVTLGIPAGQMDADRDGEIARDELFGYLSDLQDDASGELSGRLPGWFFESDADRDGQVSLAEYLQNGSLQQDMEQFEQIDINDDGLLTALEVAESKSVMGGDFRNEDAVLLPPGETVLSEIVVDDEVLIADLNVRVSITHSNTGHLDGFLECPDGTRIELFTEVGGSGNHFENTVFNDQAEIPIVKAKPPFEGEFMPEGLLKRQPSMNSQVGKPAKGVWRLVLRGTRSDRFGMLHSWGLIIRPLER
ncbi:MAG: proprotein convertase P-domain-containing protein [Planctomycetota bacterium]